VNFVAAEAEILPII